LYIIYAKCAICVQEEKEPKYGVYAVTGHDFRRARRPRRAGASRPTNSWNLWPF